MIFDYSGQRLLPFCCLVPSPTERKKTPLYLHFEAIVNAQFR